MVRTFTFLSEYVILNSFFLVHVTVHMYICTVVDCGSLSPPLNGDVSMNGTVYESVAKYTCHDGYTLMGEHHRRICLDNSSWSHQQPLCERKISLIINERVTSLYVIICSC